MYCNCHRCDRQEWCKIVKKECPEKHKWGSMILPFYDIDAFPPVELLSGHQWEDSGRTGRPLVEMCQTGCLKKSYWSDLSRGSDDVVVGEVGSGRWEHEGRPLGTEQRGGSYGTADALRHFKLSDGFPLISQQLQSSTEKAATWRRNHFHFNHVSYSAGHTRTYTHPKTHSHTNKYTRARSESNGWFQWQPERKLKHDIWHLRCSSLPANTSS